MATYVTSDTHGHLRALDQALSLAGPGVGDTLYVLGDMIDRGPEPVGVLKLVYGLVESHGIDKVHVLMGNHERMLVEALVLNIPGVSDEWEFNGGWITADQLDALPRDQMVDLVGWIHGLSLYDVVEVKDCFSRGRYALGERACRSHILCHAGIDVLAAQAWLATAGIDLTQPGASACLDAQLLRDMVDVQAAMDLLWIRFGFWDVPTGLVDAIGRGPIVVAGHTPSILLARFGASVHGPLIDDTQHGLVVEVGACRDTGGMADKIDVDASAAAGYPNGQVAVMRLEDRRVWYSPIAEGE